MTRLLLSEYLHFWKRFIFSIEFFLAALVATFLILASMPNSGHELSSLDKFTISIQNLAETAKVYGAFGFGIIMSVLTLSARWIGDGFEARVEESLPDNSDLSNYEFHLAKLSWTALCHWFLMIVSILSRFLIPEDATYSIACENVLTRSLGIALWVGLVYCLLLSFSALMSLSYICLCRLVMQRNNRSN